jgi:long-chain acyl-CoA synthetase
MPAPGQPGYYGKGSVEVGPPAEPGQSRARRITVAEKGLVTQPMEGIDTIYDVLAYAARKYVNKNAAGAREVVRIHEEEKELKKTVDGKEVVTKKKWQYFELSEFKYISFLQMKDQADAIGKGLVDIGLKKGDIFNIYAGTRSVGSPQSQDLS